MFERKIGKVLIDHNVPAVYIELALKEQKIRKKPLGEILLEMSLVNPETLSLCLAEQWRLEHFSIFTHDVQRDIPVEFSFIEENEIVPIEQNGTFVKIGMVDPMSINKRDAVARHVKQRLGKQAQFVVVSSDTYQRYLESLIHIADDEIVKALSKGSAHEEQAGKGLRLLLKKGIIERCSDIHIEPTVEGGRIKLRRNGLLEMLVALDDDQFTRLTNLIKLQSGMNQVEKQQPQDGRIDGKFMGEDRYAPVDFRVSTIPNWSRKGYAESVVIRILDRRTSILPLEDLGVSRFVMEFLNVSKLKSHGLIIFTGPTGSGKSTSIYSTMATINTISRSVVTVEDPVEYRNYLWKQIQVNDKLTMADALRSILRHDPDIIFCGEIRDEESAKIAFDMANTGHLVFTTLHANDAIKAIPRLQGLGIPNSMIEAAVLGIISQRLARVLCSCKKKSDRSASPKGEVYEAAGCSKCNNTGYKGRTMLSEHFPFQSATREALDLALDGNIIDAREQASAIVPNIRQDAEYKVLSGISSYEEIERVI